VKNFPKIGKKEEFASSLYLYTPGFSIIKPGNIS